ncbi:MAG: thiamine diphosphokinase [Eubacterium sp.]|jgi:thiamine pyrophosphokinase|nr:thiamine diphosphokinase [Eubacterium sp.]
MKRAVIVTGGRIEREFCLGYFKGQSFDYYIAADKGLQFFFENKRKPDLIVGDFDSADPKALQYFEGQEGIAWMRLMPEKDDTDTECAIRQAITLGIEEIHILGGTGSRLDHMLGTVGLLGIGLREHVEIFLVDSRNRVRMVEKQCLISKEEQYGDYVSLLPVTNKVTGVTLTGMKYPLSGYTMEHYSSLGISNEIVGAAAEITLEDGALLVIESRD